MDDDKKNYFKVKFKSNSKNTLGIGNKVEIKTKNGKQYQELFLTRGWISSVEPVLTFGIDSLDVIDQVKVTWYDGNEEILENIPANRTHTFNYRDSKTPKSENIDSNQSEKIFKRVRDIGGISFEHKENDFIDFKYEKLMPRMISREGPKIAVADVNGDGAITPDDRTFIGSPVPDYTGGLTFDLYAGNFEMTMMWYWSIGNDIFNQRKWFTDFFGSFEGSAKGAAAFNSWTPELGNNAAAPIWESASNLSTNGASNSWYVEDGSFARLQMLSLAYNFDRDKIEQFGLSKLKLGVSANNIWTITGYEGLDPMVAGPDTNFGIDVGNFPVTPSYLFNLELGILGL